MSVWDNIFTSRIFLPEMEDFPISFQLPFGVMYLADFSGVAIILGRKILMLSLWNCFLLITIKSLEVNGWSNRFFNDHWWNLTYSNMYELKSSDVQYIKFFKCSRGSTLYMFLLHFSSYLHIMGNVRYKIMRIMWWIVPKFSGQEISCRHKKARKTFEVILFGWWFQPIGKICSSNWIISPGGGIKIKNVWNTA